MAYCVRDYFSTNTLSRKLSVHSDTVSTDVLLLRRWGTRIRIDANCITGTEGLSFGHIWKGKSHQRSVPIPKGSFGDGGASYRIPARREHSNKSSFAGQPLLSRSR